MKEIKEITHTFTDDPNDPRLSKDTDAHAISAEIKAVLDRHEVPLAVYALVTKTHKGLFSRKGDPKSCMMLMKGCLETEVIESSEGGMQ